MKNTKSGFTLPELLIVVAIIAVLVAIAIPVFSAQLEKSRDAVTVSNLRGAYLVACDALLTENRNPVEGIQIIAKGHIGDLSGLDMELPFSITSSDMTKLGAGNGKIVYLTFDFTNESEIKVSVGNTIYEGKAATREELVNPTPFNFVHFSQNGQIRINDPNDSTKYAYVKPEVDKVYSNMTANDELSKSYFRFDGTNWYRAWNEGDTWTKYTPPAD